MLYETSLTYQLNNDMPLNFIVCCFFLLTTCSFGISNIEDNYSIIAGLSDNIILTNINICKWKEGARTSASFSFDDNIKSHTQISLILDQYDFKGSFYVIPSYMLIDEVKDILSREHEIGNHTYTHPRLDTLNAQNLEYEILQGKETLEKLLGKPCLSFAAPFHVTNKSINAIVFKHHLFIRNESEYNDIYRYRIGLGTASTINNILPTLYSALKSKSMLLITGHGINGNGYSSISSDFLKQILDTVKCYSNKKEIWVGTLSEVAHYENLVHEIKLDKQIIGDTIILNIKGYQEEKYKNVNTSPLSIEFAQLYDSNIQYLGNNLSITKKGKSDIITVDLKKTRVIKAIKPTSVYSESITKTEDLYTKTEDLYIYPNPASDIINIASIIPITKIEVYNQLGELLYHKSGNVKELSTSKISSGIYLLKIFTFNSTTIKKVKVNKLK